MDYRAHYEITPRMYSRGLHAHDHYEIYLHTKGGNLYCVDDIVFELEPDELIVVPPLHMHGLVCDRDLVDYERGYLEIAPESLRRCSFDTFDFTQFLERNGSSSVMVRRLEKSDADSFRKSLIFLKEHSDPNTPAEHLANFSALTSLLSVVADAREGLPVVRTPDGRDVFEGNNADGRPLTPSSNLQQQVLLYINENYRSDISVTSVSSVFNISPSTLSHEFQKFTNKGIYEYILNKRILYAKELLCTDLRFAEISDACGFNDYSNFLRVFKRITGMSPREYRASNAHDLHKNTQQKA